MLNVELYELGNDDGGTDLIVNVTEHGDLDMVKIELSRQWTWDHQVGPEVLIDEDGATEWLTLKSAERLLTGLRDTRAESPSISLDKPLVA